MKKIMCEHCRQMVEYTVLERENTIDINHKDIHYIEEYAVCNECNKEIYIGEIHDKNLKKVNNTVMELIK